MTAPTRPYHDPQIEAAVKAIADRHTNNTQLPLAMGVLGSLLIGGPLCAYLGLLDNPTIVNVLLGLGVTLAVFWVMIWLAVRWDCSRIKASKRSILSEVAAAFPDPASYALALAALRDLPDKNQASDVLSSVQQDLRQAAVPNAGTPAAGSPVPQEMASFCTQCGEPAAAGTRFCPSCGTPR